MIEMSERYAHEAASATACSRTLAPASLSPQNQGRPARAHLPQQTRRLRRPAPASSSLPTARIRPTAKAKRQRKRCTRKRERCSPAAHRRGGLEGMGPSRTQQAAGGDDLLAFEVLIKRHMRLERRRAAQAVAVSPSARECDAHRSAPHRQSAETEGYG